MKMTPGFKSTEFWVTVISTVVFAAFPDMPPEAFIAVVGYVVSRGLAKFGNGGNS